MTAERAKLHLYKPKEPESSANIIDTLQKALEWARANKVNSLMLAMKAGDELWHSETLRKD